MRYGNAHQSRNTNGIIDLIGNIDFVRQKSKSKVGITYMNMNKHFINCILYKMQLHKIQLINIINVY